MQRQVLKHNGAQCPFSGACFKLHTKNKVHAFDHMLTYMVFFTCPEKCVVEKYEANLKVANFPYGHEKMSSLSSKIFFKL